MAARIPRATYRLQFGAGFGFREATALVPYLEKLGVSDLYASPLLQARPGSPHGYDVTDPGRLNEELGSAEEFDALSEALTGRRMGLLLDVVPNHMAASGDNPWWHDVLESGPSSPYSHYFDIQWRGLDRDPDEHKLLLPVLGDHYAKVLRGGQLRLEFGASGFCVRYFDRSFPIDPKTVEEVLGACFGRLRKALPARHEAVRELAQLMALISKLPPRKQRPPRRVTERHRSKEAIKGRLYRLYRDQQPVRKALDATLGELSGTRGQPDSYRDLHRLLDAQCYRLAYWKTGRLRLNYRRFFDVSDLVGVRVDDAAVFTARHALLRRLLREGRISGLRIDHIDGLLDPLGYLERLRELAPGDDEPYVLVEKILERSEQLREDWPVHGTTGYDFLNALGRLFVDPRGLERLEQHFAGSTGDPSDLRAVSYRSRKQVMVSLLGAELEALSREVESLASLDLAARDVSRGELERALVELGALLPVYRTYVRGEDVSARDRELIEGALAAARRGTPDREVSPEAFDFLEHVLLFEPSEDSAAQRDRWLRTVGRWQQLTGPVIAKGYEDTACYVHNSLLALNEVGSDAAREGAGFGADAFHDFNRTRGSRWPGSLNATATHDTKRGEDVRARLAVLAGVAAEWEQSVKRWSHMNRPHRRLVGDVLVPDPGEEELIYQTLVGAWPLDDGELGGFRERLSAYLLKAAREAKRHTDWIDPREEYEQALIAFAETLFEPPEGSRFLRDFRRFQKKVAFYGALNGLSQTLLKLAAPGVPDVYQGSELWDLSLVDPDNRRRVDFGTRTELLAELAAHAETSRHRLLTELLERWPDGRIKLYVLWRGLQTRARLPELFRAGDYLPLSVSGPRRECVCAFARRRRKDWLVAAAPRLVSQLIRPDRFPLGKEVWGIGAVALPQGAPEVWVDELSGERVEAIPSDKTRVLRLHSIFERLPVALLTPAGD